MTVPSDSPSPIDADKQKALESMFDGLPADRAGRRAALQAIRSAFYAGLARHAQPALNEFARNEPQSTQDERSDLATTLNRMARGLGLAVACPRTGLPATIVVDAQRRGDTVTLRYRFYTVSAAGHRSATCTCYDLPELELCQAPSRVEPLAKGFRDRGEGRQR